MAFAAFDRHARCWVRALEVPIKAAICTQYGPPDVFHLVETAAPSPRPREILVRINASTVNSSDWFVRSGIPHAPLPMQLLFRARDDGTPEFSSAQLSTLKGLSESRALRPCIDRTYSLERLAEAHRHVEQDHKRGSVVISIAH